MTMEGGPKPEHSKKEEQSESVLDAEQRIANYANNRDAVIAADHEAHLNRMAKNRRRREANRRRREATLAAVHDHDHAEPVHEPVRTGHHEAEATHSHEESHAVHKTPEPHREGTHDTSHDHGSTAETHTEHDHGHEKVSHPHEHTHVTHHVETHSAKHTAVAAPSLPKAFGAGAHHGFLASKRLGFGLGVLFAAPFGLLFGATYGMWWLSGKVPLPFGGKKDKGDGHKKDDHGHGKKKDDHGHGKKDDHGHGHH